MNYTTGADLTIQFVSHDRYFRDLCINNPLYVLYIIQMWKESQQA